MHQQEVAVIYLIWIPYGTQLFENFIASYLKYQAGYEHDLILLFNGGDKLERKAFEHLGDDAGISYQSFHIPSGQDIEAYKWVAEKIQHDLILFLNSYTEFEAENWLAHYMRNMNKGVGAVGATGSYQSYSSSVFVNNKWGYEASKSVRQQVEKYKLLLKALCYWIFLFKPFPNPHLRTNAFMIRRALFLSLTFNSLTSKFKAYEFESGRRGMSAQLLKKNLQLKVIDKKGRGYGIEEWPLSKTFWKDNQEDLLISDNQTRQYQVADLHKRNVLTLLAWGKS